VHHEQDTQGRDVELRYFRDVDGREVDFVLVEDGVPFEAVECKLADGPVNPALRYLQRRFDGLETFQIAARGTKDYVTPEGVRVCPALDYLALLVGPASSPRARRSGGPAPRAAAAGSRRRCRRPAPRVRA